MASSPSASDTSLTRPSSGRCSDVLPLSLLLVVLCLTPSTAAIAQDATANGLATSQAAPASREGLIDQGLTLRQQARDEEALAAFSKAAELGRDGRVLAQVAFAEQAMGRWGESYSHLTEALRYASDPWIQEHRELLQQELAKIEQNVGRLDVRTNVAIARLTIDGKEVGTTPLSEPLVVTAGAVVISAQAAGYLSTTRRVPVHAGALSRSELVLVPEPALQRNEVTGARREEARVHRRPLWLYLSGAGALVAIASVGPWVRGEHLTDALQNDCIRANSCLQRYGRDRDRVERLDTTTNVLLIGGLTTSVLAATAYWLWPQRERAPKVQPGATLSPGAFALGATGSF